MAVILVIEDKESMAQMLRQALRGEGHEVIVARDGREGIQLTLPGNIGTIGQNSHRNFHGLPCLKEIISQSRSP